MSPVRARNVRSLALACCLLALVGVSGCTYGPFASRVTPTPGVTEPAINITESDYEEALARWRGQNVSEYEITISEL